MFVLGNINSNKVHWHRFISDKYFEHCCLPQRIRLCRGSFKGIPFEEGGGFKVNWGGDRILQYHPENLSHHGGAYFKISSGETGTIRIDLDGNLIN